MLKKQFFIAAFFVLLGSASDTLFAESTAKTQSTSWITYVDKEHSFKLSYPPGSHITSQKPEYLRIQNYESSDDVELGENQYYLEIHFHKSGELCKSWIEKPNRVQAGSTIAWMGLGDDEGDPGGIRFVLCAPRKGYLFAAVATENDMRGLIAKRILRSIKFSD